MKTGFRVFDAMTTKPVVIAPEATLEECAKVMAGKHVGTLIVKEDGAVKGIISEQDIVRKTLAAGINPLKEKVKDYMETTLMTIEPDKDIFDAIIKMKELNIRHLPVVEDGNMVGLLTLKDILKIEPELFNLLVEKFEVREESRKPIHKAKEKEGICQLCGDYSEEVKDVEGILVCDKCK